MAHDIKWRIKVERTYTKSYEVTAPTSEDAMAIAVGLAKKDKMSGAVPGKYGSAVEKEFAAEWSELDRLLVPNGLFGGSVVTEEILQQDMGKDGDFGKSKPVLAMAKKALESGATWFRVREKETKILSIDPIMGVSDAVAMGFKEYKIPGFPAKYAKKRKSMVGHQQFTYEELYGKWKEAMESVLAEKTNENLEYPYLLDIRGYPDNSDGSGVECLADDIGEIMKQMAEYPYEIDACCFTFFANSRHGTGYDSGTGFHVQDGCLD